MSSSRPARARSAILSHLDRECPHTALGKRMDIERAMAASTSRAGRASNKCRSCHLRSPPRRSSARDDRRWAGLEPPAAVYFYSPPCCSEPSGETSSAAASRLPAPPGLDLADEPVIARSTTLVKPSSPLTEHRALQLRRPGRTDQLPGGPTREQAMKL